MRISYIVLTVGAAIMSVGAFAQTAPSRAAPAAAAAPTATGYSSDVTEVGTLLDDPAAKAVLDKRMPGLTANPQIEMARTMTLKSIQQYAPDVITDKALADADADFKAMPKK